MEKERLVWIDLLNIVACAGVLLLHCTNGQVHGFSGTPSVDWYIGLATHSFFLWPVNVFFMISGFTLLRSSIVNKSEMGGVKRFYNRRWKRLGIPLLAWNILYMIKYFLSAYQDGEKLESIPVLIEKFVLFEYNGFMWFFVPLIMIYLSFPFFSEFILNSSRNLLRLFLIIGLFLGCIPPLDTDFTTREGLTNIYLMGSRFLYFIVAGYYVGHFELSVKIRRMIYACSIICMLIIFGGTMLLTLYMPEHYRYFITYTNIPCTVSAIGVFTFFRYNNWNNLLNKLKLNKNNLAYFSSFSLGIYLIQGAWFTVLGFFHICDKHILLKFFVMYVLCTGSVWVMKHVPVVRRMVS